jgi:hypothetical protein
MSVERFIKATAEVEVELNGKVYNVKPLSFRNYILVQRELRKSFAENLTQEQKEDAYIEAIELLAKKLELPSEDVLNSDNEFINKLIDVFLLAAK